MVSNEQTRPTVDVGEARDKDKTALLDAFRVFLDADAEGADNQSESALTDRQVDLYTLFSELAALKNEVKLEARQFKTVLQQLQSVTEQSENDRATLLAELDRNHKTIAEQHSREVLRPMLMQLLDLHDRMAAGLTAAGQFKRGLFTPRREMKVIHAQRQGQALTLKRLQQTLASSDVVPIKTIGLLLDPHHMRAVETESRKGVAEGVVTEELRKGFTWGDEVLRTAEVKVNKAPRK